MPFVNIRLVREAIEDDPEGKKAALAKKISAAVTETVGVPADSVWVVIEEVAAQDWFVGSTSVEERRR